MSKQIVTAAFLDNEAITLGIVEPLYLASWHDELPCSFTVSVFVIDIITERFALHGLQPVTGFLRQFTIFYIAIVLLTNIRSESIAVIAGMYG